MKLQGIVMKTYVTRGTENPKDTVLVFSPVDVPVRKI